MQTIKQIEVIPVFCEGNIPKNPFAEYRENHIYISNNVDRIGFKCLCGCEDFIMLPVNQNDNGWKLHVDSKKRITLIGSILQHNCKSHYVITNNKANFI